MENETVTLRSEYDIDGLIFAALRWYDKSPVPFNILSNVKKQHKEQKFYDFMINDFYNESTEPLLDDFMEYIVINFNRINSEVLKEVSMYSAKEIFEMNNDQEKPLILKWPNRYESNVYYLTYNNKLGMSSPEDGLVREYSVEELFDNGVRFKDGKGLYKE